MQTRQVGLEGTGEITLRRLVVEALRMRPHRLVVGEVRQAEALDLLVALNSGMPGMTSVHANCGRGRYLSESGHVRKHGRRVAARGLQSVLTGTCPDSSDFTAPVDNSDPA